MEAESRSPSKLTYEEYKHFPDDGKRHEIIDGFHVAEPAPTTYHQRLSIRLAYHLFSQIELTRLGAVFSAPVDLQLSDFDVVQPDLVVVLEESRKIITPTKIKGTPELVVEILSASTSERDRGVKKELYFQSGVPEYWVVDPDERVVEHYVRREDHYELAGKHGETVVSERIPAVRIDLGQVW